MTSARVKLPPELEGMPRFQLEDCILQATLSVDDRKMLKMYLFDGIPHADIAAELGCTRNTVSAHIAKAIQKTLCVAKKVYKI